MLMTLSKICLQLCRHSAWLRSHCLHSQRQSATCTALNKGCSTKCGDKSEREQGDRPQAQLVWYLLLCVLNGLDSFHHRLSLQQDRLGKYNNAYLTI